MSFRHFTFMESWLEDMKDWPQEEKDKAVWRLINYGIYRDNEFLKGLSPMERAWYINAFRVIDSGKLISEESAVKGAIGGAKNQQHGSDEDVERALKAGCKSAKEVAEFLEGPGAKCSWVYKKQPWLNREEIWKSVGISVDSNGKGEVSKLENDQKPLESNQIPMETKKVIYDF